MPARFFHVPSYLAALHHEVVTLSQTPPPLDETLQQIGMQGTASRIPGPLQARSFFQKCV